MGSQVSLYTNEGLFRLRKRGGVGSGRLSVIGKMLCVEGWNSVI
jgi:hypothetical protein